MSSPTSVPPRPGSAAAKKKQQQAKQPTPQFKKGGKDEPSGGNPLANPWLLGGILAVVVLVVGIIAIVSSTGGSDTDGLDFAQNRPVTVDGTPLPAEPDPGLDDPGLGQVVPEVTGQNFEGVDVTIGHGAPTLAVFLAHWCPHCNREVPELNAWRDSGEVPADLQVIAVTTAVTPGQAHYPPSTWIYDEMGWTWPVLADSPVGADAAAAFGVTGFRARAVRRRRHAAVAYERRGADRRTERRARRAARS
ncbi:MAG: hypothetical protein R2713_09605 [Ilumatobacteraceae bacterium]